MNAPPRRSKTKILVDGGDPEETLRVQKLTAQGQEMFSWIPNAYVKYPAHWKVCGLRKCQYKRACGSI